MSPNHPASVHVWEKLSIALRAETAYANPYTEVNVWVDLTGPGFQKRVYGFWDGGTTYRVRLLAPYCGDWHWRSGARAVPETPPIWWTPSKGITIPGNPPTWQREARERSTTRTSSVRPSA